MKIRLKLFTCLIAALIPLAAVGMYASHLLEQQLIASTETSLANTQRLEAARINQVLAGYAQEARALAAGSHVRSFVEAVNDYRYSVQSREAFNMNLDVTIGGYDGFAIIDPESSWPLQQLALKLQKKAGMVESAVVQLRLVDSEGKTLGETIGFSWDPANPDLINRSMRTVKTVFGDAFRNMDNEDKLGIVSPIVSNQGNVVGALLIESQLAPIVNLVAKHEGVGYSSEAHIAQPTIDNDAQFITPLRFDKRAAFNKIVAKSIELPVVESMNSPEGKVIKADDYRGVLSYLAIQTIPETGWGLIVKIDADEALAPVAALRDRLIQIIFCAFLIVSTIYLVGLWPVARRLKKTAVVARQITNGDLTARIDDNLKDEISEMASSINALAHDLEKDQIKRSEIEARLRHQALHDELTGLLNRKHANEVLTKLQKDKLHQHTVMFLDLNGFKDVNDLYGHTAGDKVLKVIADRLTAQIPIGATLARWGGDEFVVILPDTNEKQATAISLVLHKVIDEPIESDAGNHHISCSIGLSTSSQQKTLQEALVEADTLMYEQKNCQRISRSKSSMLTQGAERALNENRLEVWYQPVLKIGRPDFCELVGADTQLRIHSRDGGYVLPDDFMPEIDDKRVAFELDIRLLAISVQALNRWIAAGIINRDFQLTVQLTRHTLNNQTFPPLLEARLNQYDVAPNQLILKLPSGAGLLDRKVLANLKDYGFTLAVSGENIESKVMQHLPDLHPELALVGHSIHKDSAVLPHIISECNKLNIELVAQDIDSRDHLSSLQNLGISQFQGSLFEEPMRAVDFVSRWGQTRLTGLGRTMNKGASLRIAV
jgi:diguanylate cyclase (GGDEF)-like protein